MTSWQTESKLLLFMASTLSQKMLQAEYPKEQYSVSSAFSSMLTTLSIDEFVKFALSSRFDDDTKLPAPIK